MVRRALACANGADAVEILAAGLFMSSFRGEKNKNTNLIECFTDTDIHRPDPPSTSQLASSEQPETHIYVT